MSLRYSLLLCACLSIPFDTLAADSCGFRAAGLLSSAKTQELAALFADPAEVVKPLQRMADYLGKISDVQETSKPRFAKHKRVSIESKELPVDYKYDGYWINALSDKVGPVQFHFGRVPGSTCKLLAMHVDIEI